MAHPGHATSYTTPSDDVYDTSGKQVIVTRDPVFNHPAIRKGVIIARQPPDYLILSIVMTVINPLLGPIALFFAFMSRRALNEGDLKFAEKWSQYSFLTCMITLVASIVVYIAIGFALSSLGYRGGHSY